MRAMLISVAVATLLLPMDGHARLSSKFQHLPEAEEAATDASKIVLHIHDSSYEKSETNIMTVESNVDGIPFFHEDYWYSFQPLDSAVTTISAVGSARPQRQQQQWEIHRIPKSTRKLQTTVDELAESINSNDVGGGEDSSSNNINNEQERSGNNNKMDNKEKMSFITNILLSASCVMMAALAAGLTLGMLSLDPLSLEIKRRASSDRREQQWSEQLLPMLVGHSKRHRLLVSLLLLNSLANEALPLFLDELLPGKYAAILVSVTLVLFFGEIVPSAFFTGPNQVELAAKLVPMAKFVMFILAPIAVPIAKLLDRVLHDDDHHSGGGSHAGGGDGTELEEDVTEGNFYNRTELTALVRIQYESQMADKRRRKFQHQKLLLATKSAPPTLQTISSHISKQNSSASSRDSIHTHHSIRSISRDLACGASTEPERMPSIHQDELTMIEGALKMTTKRAADVYTPLRRIYALPSDTVMDEETMVEIWARGYSRVPVYSHLPPSKAAAPSTEIMKNSGSMSSFVDVSRIVGVLLARQLIVVDSGEERPISTLPLVVPSCISPSMHLVDLINHFQSMGGRGKGGLHLAVVCTHPHLATAALEEGEAIPKEAGVIGIVTLEDVVEELLQEEIYDEADRDLELSLWGVIKWKAFVKRKKMKRLQEQHNGVVSTASTAITEGTPLLNNNINM